jgi:antitoxin FitA
MSKMIQLRHVPDVLHKQLRAKALAADLTLSDFLLREVTAIAQLWTPDEALTALATRKPVKLAQSSTALLQRERAAR